MLIIFIIHRSCCYSKCKIEETDTKKKKKKEKNDTEKKHSWEGNHPSSSMGIIKMPTLEYYLPLNWRWNTSKSIGINFNWFASLKESESKIKLSNVECCVLNRWRKKKKTTQPNKQHNTINDVFAFRIIHDFSEKTEGFIQIIKNIQYALHYNCTVFYVAPWTVMIQYVYIHEKEKKNWKNAIEQVRICLFIQFENYKNMNWVE